MDCSVWPRPSARTRIVAVEAAVVRPRDHATHAVTAGREADARRDDAHVRHAVEVVVGRATPDQEDVEHVVELHTVVAVVVAASHLIVMEEEEEHRLEVVHVIEDVDGSSHALVKSSVDDGLVPLVVGVARHRHLYHDVRLHRLWHDELLRRLCPDAHLRRALVIDAQDRVASVRDVFIRLVTPRADAVVDIRGVVSNIAGQTLTIVTTATTTITTTMATTKCSTTDDTVPSTT